MQCVQLENILSSFYHINTSLESRKKTRGFLSWYWSNQICQNCDDNNSCPKIGCQPTTPSHAVNFFAHLSSIRNCSQLIDPNLVKFVTRAFIIFFTVALNSPEAPMSALSTSATPSLTVTEPTIAPSA